MSETPREQDKLVVGFGAGWGKGSRVNAGPIGDPIVQKVYDLSINTDGTVLFVGGNGPWFKKDHMLEADRMENEYAKLLKQGIGDGIAKSIPRIFTDTEDYLGDQKKEGLGILKKLGADTDKMVRSSTTVSNADNIVRFVKELEADGKKPKTIEVVALREHIDRVGAIVRNKLKAAGLLDIEISLNPIQGEFNEKQGQWRLRDETRFRVWNTVAEKVSQRKEMK